MSRWTLPVLALAGLGVLCWTSGVCLPPSVAQTAKSGAARSGAFVHTVIFHVKKDAPQGEVAALISDAHEMLGSIPSVRELRVGRPAEKGTPDLAKKDYEVGLLVLFDDYAGLQSYLEHPQHLKYVQKHINQVEFDKVQVFDFVDQRK